MNGFFSIETMQFLCADTCTPSVPIFIYYTEFVTANICFQSSFNISAKDIDYYFENFIFSISYLMLITQDDGCLFARGRGSSYTYSTTKAKGSSGFLPSPKPRIEKCSKCRREPSKLYFSLIWVVFWSFIQTLFH